MQTQTTIKPIPMQWEVFVRTEKHLNNDGTTDDIVVEAKLPCGANINDGTGAAFWMKQGYTIKSVWDAGHPATEEPLPDAEVEPVAVSKKGKNK